MTSKPSPMEVLTANLENLTTEAQILRGEIETVRDTSDRDRSLLKGFAVLSVLSLFQALVMIGLYFDRVDDNAAVLEKVSTGTDTIVSCTTPGQPCYESSQARTGEILKLLAKNNIEIARCARNARTEVEFEECTQRILTGGAR